MARFTATEMVGVPLTSAEVRRLLAALDDGQLPAAGADEDATLRRKLTVMMQVAEAGERRRSSPETPAPGPRRPR